MLDLPTLDRVVSMLQHVGRTLADQGEGTRAAMATELLLVYLLPLILEGGWTGQVGWLAERCGRSVRATNRALAMLRSAEAIETQPSGPRGVRITPGPLLRAWGL